MIITGQGGIQLISQTLKNFAAQDLPVAAASIKALSALISASGDNKVLAKSCIPLAIQVFEIAKNEDLSDVRQLVLDFLASMSENDENKSEIAKYKILDGNSNN